MHNLERPKFQTLRRAIEFSWATTMCWASGITNIFCTNVGIINEWVSIDIDCNTSLTQIETEQCHSTSQPACSGTVIHIRPHESAHWFLLATSLEGSYAFIIAKVLFTIWDVLLEIIKPLICVEWAVRRNCSDRSTDQFLHKWLYNHRQVSLNKCTDCNGSLTQPWMPKTANSANPLLSRSTSIACVSLSPSLNLHWRG